MKTKLYLLVLALIFFGQSVTADDGLKLSLKPTITKGFGHTTYMMDAPFADSTGTIVTRAKSELVFPLDAIYIGGELEIKSIRAGRRDWFFSAGFCTNINEPSNKMIDTDWAGFSYFKWSYTESEPVMNYRRLTIRAGKWLTGWSNANTYAFAGYRFLRVTQDIDNFKGWQIDISDTTFPRYEVDHKIHALYYKVSYHLPMAGLLYSITLNPQSYFDLTAAYMHVFASDYDDHILRHKISTSDGTGPGFFAAVNYHREFLFSNKKQAWFLEFYGEFLTLKVTTDQTQEWYGDDGISPEDDTGTIIRNIPHEFSSMQFQLGLKFGLAF